MLADVDGHSAKVDIQKQSSRTATCDKQQVQQVVWDYLKAREANKVDDLVATLSKGATLQTEKAGWTSNDVLSTATGEDAIRKYLAKKENKFVADNNWGLPEDKGELKVTGNEVVLQWQTWKGVWACVTATATVEPSQCKIEKFLAVGSLTGCR